MPDAATGQQKLNLEELVAQPTWRDELRLMVEEESLDPWNIDIADIADKFVQRIHKFKTLDLVLPANLILAAAILLHLKSEALKFEEEQVQEILARIQAVEEKMSAILWIDKELKKRGGD